MDYGMVLDAENLHSFIRKQISYGWLSQFIAWLPPTWTHRTQSIFFWFYLHHVLHNLFFPPVGEIC